MERLEEFLNFQYRTIGVLDEQNHPLLVRDRLSGRVLVQRSLPLEEVETYLALKELQCPNLVQILEVYRLKDSCIVLEEHVNGCSIKALMEQRKRLGEQEAKGIILALCQGLSALHEKHIVCRNVRPDTIRINQDGVLKLMDFSAARKFDGEKPRDTVLIGTADYAAPEQYGFSESDARTDIYAVGILLNQLLTGKHPKEKVYRGSRKLRKIIQKCTQIDKKKRYENVEMLKKALEGLWGFSEKPSRKGGKGAMGFAQKFYSGLPGLRSDAWYWKVLALILYFFLIIVTYLLIAVEGETVSTVGQGFFVFFEVLQLLVPVAIVFNAWNISRLSWAPWLVRPQFRLFLATVAWVILDWIKEMFS